MKHGSMYKTANLSTYKKRKQVLPKAIDSLLNQSEPFDKIRIYANDYEPDIDHPKVGVYTDGEDITDRGKFWFHSQLKEPEIYFSVDDDLIMPPDYVERTIEALEQYGGIVTYHGRILQGLGLNYYHGHKVFHFKYQDGQEDTKVDVMGTGVAAFYSNEFNPNVLDYEQDKMVDLVASLEAAKQNVPITCVRHKTRWIEPIRTFDAIYDEFKNDCSQQNKLADKIYNLNH